MLNADLSKQCRKFILEHWGRDGLKHVKEQPVSWVRHKANPQLKDLRRKKSKRLPLISVYGEVNRIYLALSTEAAKGKARAPAKKRAAQQSSN